MKYFVEAAHVINMYFWAQLQAELGSIWQPVNGMTPVIPAQQQPEFKESGKNFITYVYMDESTRDLYALQYQALDWTVYSPSSGQIGATLSLAKEVFGRIDESAQAVNAWMRTAQLPAGYEEFYKRFRFKQIHLQAATSAQPAVDEGGTQDGYISIEYSFVTLDS